MWTFQAIVIIFKKIILATGNILILLVVVIKTDVLFQRYLQQLSKELSECKNSGGGTNVKASADQKPWDMWMSWQIPNFLGKVIL